MVREVGEGNGNGIVKGEAMLRTNWSKGVPPTQVMCCQELVRAIHERTRQELALLVQAEATRARLSCLRNAIADRGGSATTRAASVRELASG
jgi:hypothetical protein